MRYQITTLLALVLVGCTSLPLGANACIKSNVEAKLEEMNVLIDEFTDGVKLAGSTPRMSLAPQIEDLQEIRRRAHEVEVPDCMDNLKAAWINTMDVGIDTFIDFLADKPTDFGEAIEAIDIYDAELLKLMEDVGIAETGD